MSAHSRTTEEVDHGPSGPHIAAFFDLDRTLIAGFSVFEFFREALLNGRLGVWDVAQSLASILRFQLGGIGFSGFVGSAAGMLRGVAEADYVAIGERLFRERIAPNIYPESRALVQAHHRKGHTLAIVSSATRYQIDPVARELGISHVMCTELEVKDGRFTGQVVRPACYGPGKARAAEKLARELKIDLAQSYFYTDSHEDIELLDLVGKPRPTNPNRQLAEIAVKRGWPIRRFRSRGTPGLEEIVRTGLAIGSLFPSVAFGIPAALLDRNWRSAVNLATTTWGELGTALAGVQLRVSGEEHLWSHRPAVFIFNHQSGADVLFLCRLLRRDMVGLAKKELRRNPLFGPAFALAGTVFVDRFNHDKAMEAMEPALAALRQGLSLAIAPEGTRSPTPRLGKFKKGAFHLAMAAQVPIVPIVFKNALDALPKHGVFIRPATVEVVVHPPISTRRWTRRNLDQQIERIRGLFEQTLAS